MVGAGLVQSEINRCETVLRRESAQFIIITVYNDRAFRIHVIDHFGLCFEYPVSGTETFNMRNADICKYADIRAGNLCQARHFPEIADAHFQDRDFMFFPDIEYSKGKPDFIVEVSFCLENRIFLGQYGCDHFLCAGLTHTSGDADHFDVKRATVVLCYIFQRLLAGGDADVRIIHVPEILFGYRAERTFFHHLRDECVTVHTGTFDRYEQTSLLCLAAVNDNARNFAAGKRRITV